MRIGIRGAISSLVLASIVVSAVGVHILWWRTALRISQTLADTINEQIVSAVGDELQSIDRKSTRLNSSHVRISYAVFCLKKKKKMKLYSLRIVPLLEPSLPSPTPSPQD